VSVVGRVILVGAGPGDPKLITVRGAEALADADVIVFDRLAAPALLDLAPEGAERVYVGKEPGRTAMTQEAISALLVDRALAGATVVRLKGGDPFVFGRGGEELLTCARAGVPVEVVPGITSAFAAPAAIGVPVTHRDVARSVAVVTASTAPGDGMEVESVATATDTLVLLMAAGRLEETCARLVAAGREASTPAAIVQWATTEDQRSVVGTLETLPTLALAASIGPPATLVVGDVVAVVPNRRAEAQTPSARTAAISGANDFEDECGSVVHGRPRHLDDLVAGRPVCGADRAMEGHDVLERHRPVVVRLVDLLPGGEQQHPGVIPVRLGGFEAGAHVDAQIRRIRDAVGDAAIEQHGAVETKGVVELLDRSPKQQIDEPVLVTVPRDGSARRPLLGQHLAGRFLDDDQVRRHRAGDRRLPRPRRAGEDMPPGAHVRRVSAPATRDRAGRRSPGRGSRPFRGPPPGARPRG
jgi:uroporphyrin-III C-methyltransferase